MVRLGTSLFIGLANYSIRILIIDVINFLHNVWPFVLFKIFLENLYILLLKKFEI
jgi:hypothetical protein